MCFCQGLLCVCNEFFSVCVFVRVYGVTMEDEDAEDADGEDHNEQQQEKGKENMYNTYILN